MCNTSSYLTRKQAALRLGVDVKTIDLLLEKEIIQSLKIGRHRVFTEQFLQDFRDHLEGLSEDTHSFKRLGLLG